MYCISTTYSYCCSAVLLRVEVQQLTAVNSELSSELERSRGQLTELSIELGQLRDDVSRLRGQIDTKEQAIGERSTCRCRDAALSSYYCSNVLLLLSLLLLLLSSSLLLLLLLLLSSFSSSYCLLADYSLLTVTAYSL